MPCHRHCSEEGAGSRLADTQVGNLHPRLEKGFNLRVRATRFAHKADAVGTVAGPAPLVAAEESAGRPSALLCDASGRVLVALPTEPALASQRKLLEDAASAGGGLLVRGCEVVMREGTLRVRLTAGATVTKLEPPPVFGFMAPLLSERIFAAEEEEGEEEDQEVAHERATADEPVAVA